MDFLLQTVELPFQFIELAVVQLPENIERGLIPVGPSLVIFGDDLVEMLEVVAAGLFAVPHQPDFQFLELVRQLRPGDCVQSPVFLTNGLVHVSRRVGCAQANVFGTDPGSGQMILLDQPLR